MSAVFTYQKEERLCDRRIIEDLFSNGDKLQCCFPLRVVYLLTTGDKLRGSAVIVTVPKKKIKRAVDRNYMKRVIRELYRTTSIPLKQTLLDNNRYMIVGFVFADNRVWSFNELQPKMRYITDKLLEIVVNNGKVLSDRRFLTD